MRIQKGQVNIAGLPEITGTLSEILSSYGQSFDGYLIKVNGITTSPDTTITAQDEEDDDFQETIITLHPSQITVIKTVGTPTKQEFPHEPGMTINQALTKAMLLAELDCNTDELSVVDYSLEPSRSYPTGLRNELVMPGAELNIIASSKPEGA